MITLRADNRVLVNNAKFAYLIQNYQSGVSSVELSNIEPFSVDTPILLSEMGQAGAAILKVRTISGTTITIGDVNNIATTTAHAYPESTKVTALSFDQIRFFWTAALGTIADETPTFSDGTPLTDWIDLDPSSYYTTYPDGAHSTGHGWFQYRNASTGETSLESNPIPYAGFSGNTVQKIFKDFDSGLNTNELKLVSMAEKFSWLNEALAVLKTKLNLTSIGYFVSAPQTITTISGTAEYILPDDFSDIVEIVDSDGEPIDFIPVSQKLVYNGTNPSVIKYYLRGRYIGISPTPTSVETYTYTYRAKATEITSLSTYLDVPDSAFYALKDHMMYRSCLKFGNPLATIFYQSFKNAVDLSVQSAVKRDNSLESFGITPESNT